MKKWLILIAFLVVLASPIYALPTFDLQPTTSCVQKYDNCKMSGDAVKCDIINYCESSFDLTRLGLSVSSLTSLKTMNLTQYLPHVSGIKNISYSINGDTLKISGYASKAYWTMDLGTYATLDPTWANTTYYNKSITYNVSSVAQGSKMVIFNISASTPVGYRCGREALYGGLANGSIVLLNFFSLCNQSATSLSWYFYTAPSGSNLINISLYSQNLSAVNSLSQCNMLTSTSCDSETFTGYSNRNGGAIGTFEPQQDFVREGSYGFTLQSAATWTQFYKANNLSSSGMVPSRMLINLYGYGAGVSWYYGITDSTGGTVGNVLINRVSAGQLQNYAWPNIAGIVFNTSGWNSLIYDFDASGNYNLTLINQTGAYAVNTISMVGTTASNGVAMMIGSDSGSQTLYGDLWAYGNYSAIAHTYDSNATQPPATPPNATFANLTLNGNSSNITMANNTMLNISCSINASVPLTIQVNGTEYNASIGQVSNSSYFSVGLYNITCFWSGNATFGPSNSTYFANITLYTAPAPGTSSVSITYNVDLNSAPLTCLNTSHISRNSTIYNNGTVVPLAEVYNCTFGCDSYSNSCKQSPLYSNFMLLAVLVGLFLLGFFIISRTRRR